MKRLTQMRRNSVSPVLCGGDAKSGVTQVQTLRRFPFGVDMQFPAVIFARALRDIACVIGCVL